jgi:hypothetical protein
MVSFLIPVHPKVLQTRETAIRDKIKQLLLQCCDPD